MKPFEQQTYYELLEIPVTAPDEEIRAAYERALETYSPDSVAVYALVDPGQIDALRARLTEAMEILTEPDLRAEYDQMIGVKREPTAVMAKTITEAPSASGSTAPVASARNEAAAQAANEAPAASAPVATPVTAEAPASSSASVVAAAPEPVPAREPSVAPAPQPAEPAAIQATAPVPSPAAPVVSPPPAEPADQSLAVAAPVASAPAAEPAPAPSAPVEESPRSAPTQASPQPAASASAPASAATQAQAQDDDDEVSGAHPPPPALRPDIQPNAPGLPIARSLRPTPTPPPLPGLRRPTRSSPSVSHSAPSAESAKAPASSRSLGEADQLAQESAIATAEAALAQVAAKAREPRPKPIELPPDTEFNGELLRRVRESRGLSLPQLAERTRISSKHIENVEADRYSALPATVYLRGMLMSLARELNLDPLRVSKSYLALTTAPKKK